MRADARRNREKVLSAAKDAFAEEGSEVQMDAIAHRAGVGVGTLYRHFPTKQALMTEIIRLWVLDRVAITEQAAAIEDPGAALRHVIGESAKLFHEHAGLRDAFAEIAAPNICKGESEALQVTTEQVVTRAHAAGILRKDINAEGFTSLLCGLSASISAGTPWECASEVLIAGLAPSPARA